MPSLIKEFYKDQPLQSTLARGLNNLILVNSL